MSVRFHKHEGTITESHLRHHSIHSISITNSLSSLIGISLSQFGRLPALVAEPLLQIFSHSPLTVPPPDDTLTSTGRFFSVISWHQQLCRDSFHALCVPVKIASCGIGHFWYPKVKPTIKIKLGERRVCKLFVGSLENECTSLSSAAVGSPFCTRSLAFRIALVKLTAAT